jgi:hypothetical protein
LASTLIVMETFLVPKLRVWERTLPGQLHCAVGAR